MKAGLYVRTSTELQEKGLDSQLRAIQGYCEQKSIREFEVFQDFGFSGSKLNRPGLDALMAKVRSREIDAVIVYSFSRFARSTKALILALEEFSKLGVAFVSITEAVDTSTPLGRTVFSIIASLAELERNLIQERVKNGLKAARARGQKLGREKIINSAVIIELSRKGLSQRKIAQLLGCSKTTVQRELKNLGPKTLPESV